jgi:hypothetical protein
MSAPLLPSFGTSGLTADIALLLQDCLNGMGDYFTQEVGSLNWCEAMANARAFAVAKNFITLMANQLSPGSSSVYLDEWAQIYNTLGLADPIAIKEYIELKQSEFGTPPTLNNITSYLQNQLGEIFINIQWAPELQPLATTNPQPGATQIVTPLSKVYVYVWQPRDNEDNLLMPNSIFEPLVESYRQIVQAWNPAYISFITLNLTNRGFQDGYANDYNGLNYNNYLDGYNVVSGTAGSSVLTGTGTAFISYPDGQMGDFIQAVNEGYNPPIQIVDDNGVLQTYFVLSLQNNHHMILTSPLNNNITSRTYRCLGCCWDTPGMLDSGQLLNNN